LRNLEIEDNDDQEKYSCRHCNRMFNEEAIDKHEKICKKIFIDERKKFDMKKKRILDSEHAMLMRKNDKDKKNEKAAANAAANKKAKWKKQSEEFRQMLKGKFGINNCFIKYILYYIKLT
jgi:hypothetical protein